MAVWLSGRARQRRISTNMLQQYTCLVTVWGRVLFVIGESGLLKVRESGSSPDIFPDWGRKWIARTRPNFFYAKVAMVVHARR